MNKVRGFEVAKGFENQNIQLPIQQTRTSAGYDFESAEDVTIYPIWGGVFNSLGTVLNIPRTAEVESRDNFKPLIKPVLVKTGIKAYMQDDEALFLYNRSSNPLKKLLMLANGTGIIDSDYYQNEDNDGHIMFQFINFGLFPVTIKKGEAIGQGIFKTILRADEGKHRIVESERTGGFGSTTK